MRGQVGAAPLFTVGKEALEGLGEAVKGAGVGLHVPLAEDPLDEKLCGERHGASPVVRLVEAGQLSPQAWAFDFSQSTSAWAEGSFRLASAIARPAWELRSSGFSFTAFS